MTIQQTASLRHRIGLWAGPAVFLAMRLAPAPASMPAAAWGMAAVAVWMAVWWVTEAVPIAVTSLLPLPLFPGLGLLSSMATAAHYGNHLIFLFLGGFVLALALETWGLHRRLALAVVARVGAGPRRILLGFMIGSALLSMWMSNTAATLVMLPIGAAAVEQIAAGARLEGKAGAPVERLVRTEFGAVLMLGLAYSASVGGLGTLIGTPTNLAFAAAVREIFPGAPEVGFVSWMLVGLPVAVVFLALIWFYLTWRGTRIDLGKLEPGPGAMNGRDALRALGPMSAGERWVGVVFCLAALAWLSRSSIAAFHWPGWSSWFVHPGFLHDATVAMAAALLLLIVPAIRRDGRRVPALTWEAVQSRTPWGILLLFGGGLALAGGFQETGLAGWIGARLGAMAAVPPIALVVLTCLLVTFLTELTSNTATVTMLMPVLAATAAGAHLHPFLLMLPAALSGSCAFMLPVATPPNAVIFGSGWVDVPRMARTGLWLNLAGVIVVTLIVWFVARPVFGIGVSPPSWAAG